MGFLKRIWDQIRSIFGGKVRAGGPGGETQNPLDRGVARREHLSRRAAELAAHRIRLLSELEGAAGDVGEARELAKQALLEATRARAEGDSGSSLKWSDAATAFATKLVALETNLASVRVRYQSAHDQGEDAQEALRQNAEQLRILATRQKALVGEDEGLEIDRLVEEKIAAFATNSHDGPPDIDEMIETHKTGAAARAQLPRMPPDQRAQGRIPAEATAKLEELKRELGI